MHIKSPVPFIELYSQFNVLFVLIYVRE